jgi:uncharacterized protein (TIGR03067 family)
MKNTLMIALSVGLLVLGCSKSHKPDSVVLQGKWSGQEVGAKTPGSSSLVFEGTKCEFHGANPQEWYKATFSLREDTTPKQLEAVIIECPFPQYVGKTARGIYKLEEGKLTFAANEPGQPAVPASFDAQGARKFVLTLK